jgi:hypothetical protein
MKPATTGAVAARLPHRSPILLLLVFPLSFTAFFGSPRKSSGQPGVRSDPDLIVHEWGTFTSIAGHNGDAIDWLPLTGSTDLPSFVEHLREPNFKGGLRGTVRMETPVLYFYSPRETTVSVKVALAKGLITEWYPHSSSAAAIDPRKDFSLYLMQSQGPIAWDSVHIEPGGPADFPRDTTENHYYAARETSAAPIRVQTPSGDQRERFLFYRGVSSFKPPISASLSPDGTVLLRHPAASQQSGQITKHVILRASDEGARRTSNSAVSINAYADTIHPQSQQFFQHAIPATYSTASKSPAKRGTSAAKAQSARELPTPEPIANVILFERRGDKLGYRILGPLQDQASLAPPELNGSLDSLFSALEGILISQGLYADEAHAMLETWKNSWFEEGSRLIYIVPRSFVDSVLPLSISPAPAEITRVFIGRLELVTPATEQAVESAFARGDLTTLAKYSRVLEPILQTMTQQSFDPTRQRRLASYLKWVYNQPRGSAQ